MKTKGFDKPFYTHSYKHTGFLFSSTSLLPKIKRAANVQNRTIFDNESSVPSFINLHVKDQIFLRELTDNLRYLSHEYSSFIK